VSGALAALGTLQRSVLSVCLSDAGASEISDLFRDLGRPLSSQKLFDLMEQYDIDQSGQIEFNEFLRLFWCAPARCQ
jgi:hypothetical protein